jgi:hypothetical protein
MKPTIKRRGDFWACWANHGVPIGYGATPHLAYMAWWNEVQA